jgi:hypothetical protein
VRAPVLDLGRLREPAGHHGDQPGIRPDEARCAGLRDRRRREEARRARGISVPRHRGAAENKIIKVGVTRLENLISRGAFVVRRGIGALQVWMLGMNSARAGTPIEGSRLIWEIDNWQYPKTDEAKVQKDVPTTRRPTALT